MVDDAPGQQLADYRRNAVATGDFGKQSCGNEDDGKAEKKLVQFHCGFRGVA